VSSPASPFFPFKWRTFYSSFLLNKQVQNIVWSFIFRIGAIGSNFFLVPLIINQLSELEYGILVTLMSITTWFTFIDFGLANGLKNKISESTASGNILNVKKYISTAYYTLFKVLLF
jgi:O-antigen/teichoic acid export membrane protein